MDEVQDRLAGAAIFSKLDLQRGFWQLPMEAQDREKTAFSPGPGMRAYEFTEMPFGLCGAPSSFQRLMDTILRGLPFVTTYMDDVLIHSSSEEIHSSHLEQVLHRLQKAELTLRGNKCQIGLPEVAFLGHVFSGAGVKPDKAKVKQWKSGLHQTLQKKCSNFWGWPHTTDDLCQGSLTFQHLDLHHLTQKDVHFSWTKECNESFQCLKRSLTEAPILAFPHFDLHANPFILQTDASARGLGAILQQDAYASRVLNKAECNYSVIQRECLAAVYGMKQFRHYLLGRPFELWTDREPLKWLANQKLEGMLGCWALALQEYSFTVVYRRGSQNTNADALSRRRETGMATLPAAVTRADMQTPLSCILAAQKQDQVIKLVAQALKLWGILRGGTRAGGPVVVMW